MIKEKLLQYLCQFRNGSMDIVDAHSSILALLAENEVGVSDASGEHGDLPHVGKRNASEAEADSSMASEQRPLDNRIEAENVCWLREHGRCKCPQDYCYKKDPLND